MRRFFGMMPSNEVKMTNKYVTESGDKVVIEACEHGWTIIYADASTEFKDFDDTVQNNFDFALRVLKSRFNVVEIKKETEEDVVHYTGIATNKKHVIIREFAHVINSNNLESASDTPDFLLAEYLLCCLENYNRVSIATKKYTVPFSNGICGERLEGGNIR